MLVSRDKLLLACLIIGFSVAPCFGQIGGVSEPPFGPQFPGTPQANPNLSLAASGAIVGAVHTMDNKPVANARVEVISLTQGPQRGAQFTARDGSFTINNLPAGTYELRAESGLQEASMQVQVSDGQTWVNLRFPAGGAAQGGDGSAPSISVKQLRVPEKAVSLLGKARQAISKNHLDRAAHYLAKALTVYPHYAEALALRAVLELQGSHFQQAEADANHAIQSDPDYGVGYLVMGAALNCQRKYQDALLPLERAEALAPAAWQGYFESSKALLQLGKYQDALQQVNRAMALEKAGNHPELHLMKGYAYAGLHTYDAALGELQQYLTQDPGGPYAEDARASLAKIRPLAAAAVAR